MTGQTFAQALADDGRIPNAGTTIASNPEQSKHLETTKVKMEGLEVDLVNLRSEKYTADSRIPIMVSLPSHRAFDAF
jgi:tRNA nucleotidyltransferase (CCA-adding enzyme)